MTTQLPKAIVNAPMIKSRLDAVLILRGYLQFSDTHLNTMCVDDLVHVIKSARDIAEFLAEHERVKKEELLKQITRWCTAL
jgi:hypothetical protein